MTSEVFEKMASLNRGFDQIIADLKFLEKVEWLNQNSIALYTREAGQLRMSVNFYVAEMIEKTTDEIRATTPPLPDEHEEER